jgi:hypothetical protein
VLDWKPPHAKWFVGGTINASACVVCFATSLRGRRSAIRRRWQILLW